MTQHTNDSNFSFGSFLTGALIGGAIGAVVAILRAPQSGEETRQLLKKGADTFKAEAEKAISEAQQHGKTAMKEINDHVANIKDEMKQAVDVAVEEGKSAAKQTEKIAREGAQDIEEDLKGA